MLFEGAHDLAHFLARGGAGLANRGIDDRAELRRVEALIAAAIAETGAQSKKEMGKVIGALKKHPDAGLIDFGAASKLVQAKLP